MTAEPRYTIMWTDPAVAHLKAITDRRERALIAARAEELAQAPEQQGKALVGELAELRSVRAVGQRFRIIYQVRARDVIVVIVAAGRRKDGARLDIYALAKKLVAQGLVPPPPPRARRLAGEPVVVVQYPTFRTSPLSGAFAA